MVTVLDREPSFNHGGAELFSGEFHACKTSSRTAVGQVCGTRHSTPFLHRERPQRKWSRFLVLHDGRIFAEAKKGLAVSKNILPWPDCVFMPSCAGREPCSPAVQWISRNFSERSPVEYILAPAQRAGVT